jgi:uncharacterized membrane protein YebE (DUF533 family)
MFLKGFNKTAVAIVTMTPEQYFETVGEKDKYVGAVSGAAAGSIRGLVKGKKGHRSKAGLIGNAVGGALGGAAGHYGGKVLRNYQTRKVHHIDHDLKLRTTQPRSAYHTQGED